jgi:type III secretion protein V
VPLVSGRLELDRLWALVPASSLRSRGVRADEVLHPGSGDATCWIDATDRDAVVAAGVTVQTPIDFLIAHLREVIEGGLPDFLGQQEVENLLEGVDLLAEAQREPASVTELVAALRALVAERVPITALPALWAGFVAARKGASDPVSIAEELRKLPEVRPHLPVNNIGLQRFALGDRLANVIEGAIQRIDPVPVLAMMPTDCQDALTAVRTALATRQRAVVVCACALRPFVRKLVEIEFPGLFVACEEELLSPPGPETLPMEMP